MHEDIYSKEELIKRLKRYCQDEKRYLPIAIFAKECDISYSHFVNTFLHEKNGISLHLQIRASRVLKNWENGNYAFKQNKYGDRFLEHRASPKARLKPDCQLYFGKEGIKLKIGMKNLSDYGDKEELFHGAP